MPINVSEALDSDTAELITVKRTAAGGYVNGLYVKGAETTFKALASVQQPTAQDLKLLPEGERNRDVRKFISNKPVRTTNDLDDLIADVIVYKSMNFKLINVEDWNAYGHTTVFGVRV